MIGAMPGTNLTRDEAATRAALLDVTSYWRTPTAGSP